MSRFGLDDNNKLIMEPSPSAQHHDQHDWSSVLAPKQMEQVKRIYEQTRYAIDECNFLNKHELEQILLTPSEEKLVLDVDGSQLSPIKVAKAATLLRDLHARFLRKFVLSAFDLTWDMITTPKRFEYAKQKELELYNSLMGIANLKQDEIKVMIRETINSIKQDLLDTIASATFSIRTTTTSSTSSSQHNHHTSNHNSNHTSNHTSNHNSNHNHLAHMINNQSSTATTAATPTTSSLTTSSVAALTEMSSSSAASAEAGLTNRRGGSSLSVVGGGGARAAKCRLAADLADLDLDHHHNDHNHNHQQKQGTNEIEDEEGVGEEEDSEQEDEEEDDQYCYHHRSVDSSSSHLTNFSVHSIENISSRSELQLYRQEIQEFVLQQLNASIASKLVGSVESLRNSYVGTLERCLASLVQNCVDNNEPPNALLALRQILNAAYRVEVSVQSSTSLLRVLWEKMKKLMGGSFASWSLYWTNHGCIIDEHWKRQQALDILDNLSETRLAKSICAQFRARLKISHEQFQQSIKDLEQMHAGRLQHTEDLRLRVRKMHAPRMAKFALESTSLIDVILHGMPRLEKEIGRGQYGVVYACGSWAGHSPCAVKSVVPPDDKHWYDLAMEFYYTRCIPEHERIVSIYGSVIDHSYGSGSTPAVLLIMERFNRDLYSAIKFGLDWLSRLQVAIDVVEGIRFLHNQGLVHRDIKLKNILLDANNRAKLTDLGFCKPEAMMSGSVVGTPIHMSPELFSGRYDNSVDVYAFGILFWYICAGHVRLPHIFEQCQTRDQLWNCVRRGVRPERLPQFDNECWQLMVQCWDGDRSKRPHLGDVEIRLRQIRARYT